MRTRDTVQKAEEFIEGEYEKGTEFCNYGLALSTFALHKTVASRSSTTRDRLVTDLRRRITTSKMCKLINQKPRNELCVSQQCYVVLTSFCCKLH